MLSVYPFCYLFVLSNIESKAIYSVYDHHLKDSPNIMDQRDIMVELV